MLIAAVSTCVMFPGQVTATAAGVLFGVAAGVALTLAAATLGATLAFLLARGAGAAPIGRLLGPRAAHWRAWIAERGFSAVLTARLLPGTPASVLNYAAGLTAMPLRAFAAAVALGALPKTVAYVALGGALSRPALDARACSRVAPVRGHRARRRAAGPAPSARRSPRPPGDVAAVRPRPKAITRIGGWQRPALGLRSRRRMHAETTTLYASAIAEEAFVLAYPLVLMSRVMEQATAASAPDSDTMRAPVNALVHGR